jgi:hypothetical protein
VVGVVRVDEVTGEGVLDDPGADQAIRSSTVAPPTATTTRAAIPERTNCAMETVT